MMFRRDGHLSEHGAERVAAEARSAIDDEDGEALAPARAHSASCATCRARVAALAAPFDLPVRSLASAQRAHPRWRAAVLPLASAAAALLVFATTSRDGSDMRRKGGPDAPGASGDASAPSPPPPAPLSVELAVQRDGAPLADGAVLAAGDEVTLALGVSAPSYVAVWGFDSTGERYAIHPAAPASAAAPWAPSAAPLPLPRAVAFDGRGERETMFAVACPFAWSTDADVARLLREGCVARSRSFAKTP